MNSTFQLTLRTPQKTLFEGEAKSIAFAGEDGAAQLFAHHASLTASIAFCPVRIERADGNEENYMVRNGMMVFNNAKNSATLIALHGEAQSEISHQTAKEYLQFIEEKLAKGEALGELQILHLKGEKLAIKSQLNMME